MLTFLVRLLDPAMLILALFAGAFVNSWIGVAVAAAVVAVVAECAAYILAGQRSFAEGIAYGLPAALLQVGVLHALFSRWRGRSVVPRLGELASALPVSVVDPSFERAADRPPELPTSNQEVRADSGAKSDNEAIKAGQLEIARLRSELERVTAERDLLEKSAAYFAARVSTAK